MLFKSANQNILLRLDSFEKPYKQLELLFHRDIPKTRKQWTKHSLLLFIYYFLIIDGNTYNAFQVNSTGAIISRLPLDYENDTQKTFDLTVMVTDGLGLTDKTQVRITVLDANDNDPMIINLPSPREFNISDNVPAGLLNSILPNLSFFLSFSVTIVHPCSLSFPAGIRRRYDAEIWVENRSTT